MRQLDVLFKGCNALDAVLNEQKCILVRSPDGKYAFKETLIEQSSDSVDQKDSSQNLTKEHLEGGNLRVSALTHRCKVELAGKDAESVRHANASMPLHHGNKLNVNYMSNVRQSVIKKVLGYEEPDQNEETGNEEPDQTETVGSRTEEEMVKYNAMDLNIERRNQGIQPGDAVQITKGSRGGESGKYIRLLDDGRLWIRIDSDGDERAFQREKVEVKRGVLSPRLKS